MGVRLVLAGGKENEILQYNKLDKLVILRI